MNKQATDTGTRMRISANGIRDISSVELPIGRYLVIDPCYLIRNYSDWDNICNSFQHRSNDPFDNLHVNFILRDGSSYNGLIFGTAHGDGVYPVFDNYIEIGQAGVDAGLLSFIPEAVVKEFLETESDANDTLGVWVEVKPSKYSKPYFIDDCQGDVRFSNIEVHTGEALKEICAI